MAIKPKIDFVIQDNNKLSLWLCNCYVILKYNRNESNFFSDSVVVSFVETVTVETPCVTPSLFPVHTHSPRNSSIGLAQLERAYATQDYIIPIQCEFNTSLKSWST